MKWIQDINSQEYKEDEIEKEIRRKEADWKCIESLPDHLRKAVKLFIETGDLRLAQHLSRLDLEDFIEVLKKCNVPVFITFIK